MDVTAGLAWWHNWLSLVDVLVQEEKLRTFADRVSIVRLCATKWPIVVSDRAIYTMDTPKLAPVALNTS